jgi:hypothetical protein
VDQILKIAQAAQAAAPSPLLEMFQDGNSLVRAVLAAEILGPPVALKEPNFWNQRPNEPSI